MNIMAADRITRTLLADKINKIIILKGEGKISPPTSLGLIISLLVLFSLGRG